MSTFFITDTNGNKIQLPKQTGNGKAIVSSMLAFTMYGSFALLGGFLVISHISEDSDFIKNVWDGVNNVIIMLVGGFLALIKEIFHPRREITIDNMIDLLNKITEAKSGAGRRI